MKNQNKIKCLIYKVKMEKIKWRTLSKIHKIQMKQNYLVKKRKKEI